MLQTIRDKLSGWVAKIVLGSIVIVFVLWGVEGNSSRATGNDAAVVNGDKISLSDARNVWQRELNEMQQSFKGEIPEVIKKQRQQMVLDELIRDRLVQSQVDKLGYTISEPTLIQTIQSRSDFMVEGKFDPVRYSALLAANGLTRLGFEEQEKKRLAKEKLQQSIVSTAFTTPAEVARAQAMIGEEREIEYATVSAQALLATVNVSDADIEAYYAANKNNYMSSETVGLQYVEINSSDSAAGIEVTDELLRTHYEQIKDKFSTPERRRSHHILIKVGDGVDDAAAKKQADNLYSKLKSGANFEKLAKENSKDLGSAVKGGDLGWAKRGDFVKPFEDTLFAMNPGDLSAPVKSDFGYHIIRLDEIEGSAKTFDQVRAQVETDYRNEQAHAAFYDRTQKLADSAFEHSSELESVAKQFNTTVKTISGFSRDGGGEFAKGSPVIDAAFSEAVLEKGQNSPLVTLGEDRALVVRINDHKVPEQKPLTQVREEIVTLLKAKAAGELALQKSTEIAQQLQAGSIPWTLAVKQASATLVPKQGVTRFGSAVPAPVVKSAFAIAKGAISHDKPAYGSVEIREGEYAIFAVSSVKSGSDAPNAAQELMGLKSQLGMMVGKDEFSTYVQELSRKAKIEKNPAAFE